MKLDIYNSSSIGGDGTRYLVNARAFSTNEEDNKYTSIGISTTSIDSARPYYNGVFNNLTSKYLTIRIAVYMD